MATISMSGTTKQKPCLYYKGHSYIKDRSTSNLQKHIGVV